MSKQVPYTARELNPANPHLPRSASVAALVGYKAYVTALAKVVYYWGYPFVDVSGRTSQWQLMREPGTLAVGGPVSRWRGNVLPQTASPGGEISYEKTLQNKARLMG